MIRYANFEVASNIIASMLITLVKILEIRSIRDSVENVILVGKDISGKGKLLAIRSKKSDTSASVFNFNRFMLISSAINMLLLFSVRSLSGSGLR